MRLLKQYGWEERRVEGGYPLIDEVNEILMILKWLIYSTAL